MLYATAEATEKATVPIAVDMDPSKAFKLSGHFQSYGSAEQGVGRGRPHFLPAKLGISSWISCFQVDKGAQWHDFIRRLQGLVNPCGL